MNVGNGINWKGQVFSKMRNHTATNRMTGVGNTLKRHYAFSNTNWLTMMWMGNAVYCVTVAHREIGLTAESGQGRVRPTTRRLQRLCQDGLEYICPQCSITTYKNAENGQLC
uniref:Uncharacterized protein n=1 Tax=Utricularia reniformis TaxID=192314 RepID=A0A1Y0B467_9LAMI|nr:hypothetical protein AEK19_MT2024 [Utricularia reniformis]ART32183.1 hypothetical protein AEK19_MT2024 [Utricularia reniformis]